MGFLFYIIGTILVVFGFSILKWLYQYLRVEYYFYKFDFGPKGWPYPIGNFLEIKHTDERMLQLIRQYSLTYYPMYKYRIGPKTILNLVGPDEIEGVVSSSKHMQKSWMYNLMQKWLRDGLLLSFGAKWQSRRKILTPAFHFTILRKFIDVFNTETQTLVSEYLQKCGDKTNFELDVVGSITQFTLASITETSMGTKLDMNNSEHKDYKIAINQLAECAVERFVRPWLLNNFFYYNFTSLGYKEKNIIKTLHNFTQKIIRNKAENFQPFSVDDSESSYSRRKTMALLDILLNAKYKDGNIDELGIQEEVDTFLFEGHDTTSMAICFTMMLLANHPEHQTTVFEEMQQVLGDNNNPTYEQLNELKFLERCIKESLRLYPSVHFMARVLSEDWVSKSGHKFAKGSTMHIHVFDLHRSPKLYENPSQFNPDRFLPENVKNIHPFAYLPFSAGPRNCIGQRFAILEMKAVLCGILQKFKLEPIDTPETIILVPNFILKSKNGVKVKFVKR